MQFTADQYFWASQERMTQARILYREGKAFALAMYCGGLAVESLLRAFRWTADPSFEGRHDLLELLKASRLLQVDVVAMRRKGSPEGTIYRSGVEVRGAMNEIASLWNNSLRFASEARLRTHLNKLGRLQGVKGDPLKKNALDLLSAAQRVIDRGVALWMSEIRS